MKHIKTFEGFLNEAGMGPSVMPYQFKGDRRGEELYTKYYKAFDDKAWDEKDSSERSIKLDVLMKITGLSLKELEELSKNYGDESWSLNVDAKGKIVTEYTD